MHLVFSFRPSCRKEARKRSTSARFRIMMKCRRSRSPATWRVYSICHPAAFLLSLITARLSPSPAAKVAVPTRPRGSHHDRSHWCTRKIAAVTIQISAIINVANTISATAGIFYQCFSRCGEMCFEQAHLRVDHSRDVVYRSAEQSRPVLRYAGLFPVRRILALLFHFP